MVFRFIRSLQLRRRKQAEDGLSQSAARYRVFFQGLSDGAAFCKMLYDDQGRPADWIYLDANQALERLFGMSDLIGKRASELFPTLKKSNPELFEIYGRTALTGQPEEFEGWLPSLGLWMRLLVFSPEKDHFFAISTDVTEKKKIELQFLRAQRMESIGALAGGIAHDLNNVLAPILMAIQTLQQRFTDEESQHWLSLLRQGTERGRDILAQVLTFARGTIGERLALNPAHLVNGTVSILKETFPKNIAVQVSLPGDLWEVVGDATQLHQVLLNLCLNARDAMPDGGRLSIKVENMPPNFPSGKLPPPFSKQCVCITVADTGLGIPANLLDRIFEPFFTTKPPGQGTGLGLATTLGIVKSHGGLIDVTSKVGAGTQFKTYLPANNAAPAEPSAAPSRELHTGNGELILVVDDEPEVREITKATLEAFGYRVLAAGDGQKALALYSAHQNEIQAVLTDVVMPILDGVELAQSLSQLFPDAKVIVTSGLPFNGHFSAEIPLNISAFLSKPYSAENLLSTLAEVLTNTH